MQYMSLASKALQQALEMRVLILRACVQQGLDAQAAEESRLPFNSDDVDHHEGPSQNQRWACHAM